MIVGLVIVLLLTLLMPFLVKAVEHNLEIFLFAMGISAAVISGVLTKDLVLHILENHFLYMIAGAVLIAGLVFKFLKSKIKGIVDGILKHISIRVFVFLTIVILGFISSAITAIIASLLLVEIVNVLPLERKEKININILACFSIGLGAALTPLGEPIATIVISKLNENFWYLFREIGVLAVVAIVGFGIAGIFFVSKAKSGTVLEEPTTEEETYSEIIFRTIKIFVFVIALELLGSGFKPIIDTYVINLDGRILYWGNMISAILDNATLAAAEISPKMSPDQIKVILMGLLISGGMLVPGNIPNIISASKLKINSKEWARLGVPVGLITLSIYFIVLFII